MHPSPAAGRIVLLAAAALLAASCGAPGTTAAPQASPTSSAAPSSSAGAVPGGPAVTVPGLSSSSAASVTPPSSTPDSTAPESGPAEPSPPEPSTPGSSPVDSTPSPGPSSPPSVESSDEPADTPTPDPTTQAPPPPAPVPTVREPVQQPSAPARAGGAVVVVDAGHNGANGANPSVINALVDAGFGQRKPCNTTGTETDDGYTESTFTFGVAQYLVPMLEAEGITVVTTRDSNDGVGPCVDRRAAIGNDARADAVVSIHGDGDDASAEGFYVMTAQQDPAGAAVAGQSQQLAVAVRDGLEGSGLSPSNHLGSDGLWRRGDLAGLNLSQRPTVMIEAGNMRNATDAALMTSADGQRQVARGLADGVLAYLAATG